MNFNVLAKSFPTLLIRYLSSSSPRYLYLFIFLLNRFIYFSLMCSGQIRFEPNSEILQSSIIGHIVKLKQSYFKLERLQEVKSKMLITSTENEKISLDVVGLCLDWDSNILISERTEGRLMQLNMNGSILSKSNFRSEFKNSCGVCINSKKEILVTDGKLNKIFKFNSNLKLLQIIGSYLGTRYGSLNFPW